MSENDPKQAAKAWLDALRARGVEPRLIDYRRVALPADATESLTDEERNFWWRHRAAIKDVLREEARAATERPAKERLATVAASPSPSPSPRTLHDLIDAMPKPEPRPIVRRLPAEQPQPEVMFRGVRVSESDVRNCLKGLGDDALAAYECGELTRWDAYEMTRAWLEEGWRRSR